MQNSGFFRKKCPYFRTTQNFSRYNQPLLNSAWRGLVIQEKAGNERSDVFEKWPLDLGYNGIYRFENCLNLKCECRRTKNILKNIPEIPSNVMLQTLPPSTVAYDPLLLQISLLADVLPLTESGSLWTHLSFLFYLQSISASYII